MDIQQFLNNDLLHLDSQSLRRSLREVEGGQSREIVFQGKKVLNFCSNNYLGIADDERLKQAATQAIARVGIGSGASRLVCGTMSEHVKLEKAIARLKGTEQALVYSSGYMANTGIIQALVDREDEVFSDKLNHASIVDGIILSRAKLSRYPHNDMAALEAMLKSSTAKKRLIVTDTVFSMDGDVAPLNEIVAVARRYDAWVMVDEAHAFGVLGAQGGGLVEQEGLQDKIEIQMGTLSKAAGCFGAYVAGSTILCEYLVNHSRSFIYTTSIPPALAAAATVAVDIIRDEPQRRERVLANAKYLREGLKALGLDTLNSTTPIIPVILKDSARAVEISKRLLEQGIFVQAIRPPTVPVNMARLRVTVMATHRQEDLDRLLNCMRKII